MAEIKSNRYDEYIYVEESNSWEKLLGNKGEKGDKGDDGYTPVKDVDYFDGEDGFSPRVTITEKSQTEYTPRRNEIEIEAANGTNTAIVYDGVGIKEIEFERNDTNYSYNRVRLTDETYQTIKVRRGDKGDKGEDATPKPNDLIVIRSKVSNVTNPDNAIYGLDIFEDKTILELENKSQFYFVWCNDDYEWTYYNIPSQSQLTRTLHRGDIYCIYMRNNASSYGIYSATAIGNLTDNKQDKLSTSQMNAVNSGITALHKMQYDTYATSKANVSDVYSKTEIDAKIGDLESILSEV